MGFFSGVTNAISSVIGGATKAASKWGGTAIKAYGAAKSGNILSLIGTVGSSLMEKKAGVYRWEVNLFSSSRKPLHQLIDHLQAFLYQPKQTRRVRWSIDVDPISII